MNEEESKMALPHLFEFDPREVCKYHIEEGGVICDARKRTDYDCTKCGWNPKVSRRRAWKIREERRKLNVSD